MLTHLDLQRFRGFSSLAADLRPVSVLFGPNSPGKSSVLQAVRLACSALAWVLRQGPIPKLSDGWIVLWWDYPVREDEAFLPAVDTNELFLNKGEEPLVVTLSFSEEDFIQELQVSLRYGQNFALKLDVRAKSSGALEAVEEIKPQSKFFSPRLLEALLGKEPLAVMVPSFYGVVREEPYVNDARLERLLGAGEQGSVARNLIARLGSTKELNDLLLLSVGASLARSTSGQGLQEVEHLAVHFRDKNGELELCSAGTGLVALMALFSSLKWYQARAAQGRSFIFLLDEPEAHLHPRLQGDTGARIAELITSFGAQVLLATHSVEMINRLGERDDAVLIGIDRNAPDTAIELSSESKVRDALGLFCDLTPFVGLQLLTTRRILLGANLSLQGSPVSEPPGSPPNRPGERGRASFRVTPNRTLPPPLTRVATFPVNAIQPARPGLKPRAPQYEVPFGDCLSASFARRSARESPPLRRTLQEEPGVLTPGGSAVREQGWRLQCTQSSFLTIPMQSGICTRFCSTRDRATRRFWKALPEHISGTIRSSSASSSSGRWPP